MQIYGIQKEGTCERERIVHRNLLLPLDSPKSPDAVSASESSEFLNDEGISVHIPVDRHVESSVQSSSSGSSQISDSSSSESNVESE